MILEEVISMMKLLAGLAYKFVEKVVTEFASGLVKKLIFGN